MSKTAIIFYGRGSDLGNFKVFGDSLARELSAKYSKQHVLELNVELRQDFFDILRTPPFMGSAQIAEFHIFSHAIGGGLFLAYHDQARHDDRERAKLAARNRSWRLSYYEVLLNELGTVFTDDLIRHPFSDMRDEIRKNFAPNAFVKIWGCNSGVADWIYGDDPYGASSAGPIDSYYFRALNEQNRPKPSVAQAFADYFGRRTYGARTGSHIEVLTGGHWIKSSDYRRAQGHWPPPKFSHRLAPDQGAYHEFAPASP